MNTNMAVVAPRNILATLSEKVLDVIETFVMTVWFLVLLVTALVASGLAALSYYDELKEKVLDTGLVSEATFTKLTIPATVIKAVNEAQAARAVLSKENAELKSELAKAQQANKQLQEANVVLGNKADVATLLIESALVPEASVSEFTSHRIIEPAEENIHAASSFVRSQVGAAKEYIKRVLQ